MEYQKSIEYKNLIRQWKQYKEVEDISKTGRLKTEKALVEMTGDDLVEKGTNNFPLGLQIVTGFSESWDQDAISRIKTKCDDGVMSLPTFPFKREWKPDNQQMTLLKAFMGDDFDKSFAEALTIKPKKPAFKMKDKKDE